MLDRSSIASIALAAAATAAALALAGSPTQAFDESKYPDWKGQWDRTAAPRWADPAKAPLTAEYRAIFEENLKDQATGGQGTDPTITCVSPGMPRIMNVYDPMEIVITPDTVHIFIEHVHDSRRIYTDGRSFSDGIEPTYAGYSIGTWIDEDQDGRYDVLAVETRHMRGPRSFDSTGLPLHHDNETVVKERIQLDKADRNIMHNEITVFDHALTRPWTITKDYRRIAAARPVWREAVCAEGNQHVVIGNENYFLSADGFLMPAKKDQKPPDLRYFKQATK